ncbi:MAG: DUF1343 domain-containing protein [Bacteroidota bacterium]
MRFFQNVILLAFFISSCNSQVSEEKKVNTQIRVQVGAGQFDEYLDGLKGKKVALVVNQTSVVENIHLVDTLLSLGIDVQKIFAPEHGFRGQADAGETVSDSRDLKTGIPIVSIYGKNKKPSAEQLDSVDVVVFDIQDVGARFYTYISSMHYVMEACAEMVIPFVVLDRPNPNGDYVDGSVLEKGFESFVGLHPIPVVHGMTVGELAKMINKEGWLSNSIQADLKVIKTRGWDHKTPYELPIKPSPNLPNSQSIKLYPSLCFFEGTIMSVGRGTDFPFQVIGYPNENYGEFSFTPKSNIGAKYPKHQEQKCYGADLRNVEVGAKLDLSHLIKFYTLSEDKEAFFNGYFDKLAGNSWLREWIMDGKTESEIRKRWSDDLNRFRKLRLKYLLYADFE